MILEGTSPNTDTNNRLSLARMPFNVWCFFQKFSETCMPV